MPESFEPVAGCVEMSEVRLGAPLHVHPSSTRSDHFVFAQCVVIPEVPSEMMMERAQQAARDAGSALTSFVIRERFLYLSSLLECFPPAYAAPITDKLMRLYNGAKQQVAS